MFFKILGFCLLAICLSGLAHCADKALGVRDKGLSIKDAIRRARR